MTKSQAGKVLSKAGASKGGIARAASMTRAQRSASAAKAATARWNAAIVPPTKK